MKQNHSGNETALSKTHMLQKAWEKLASNRTIVSNCLREDIAHSWRRCLASNVNPLGIQKNTNIFDIRYVLEQYEKKCLLDIARPYMKKLYDAVRDEDGFIVMIVDADKVTLEILGDKKMADFAGDLSIVAGALCSEEAIGTTSAGICFSEKRPARVLTFEHYVQELHSWCCSAAPIFDSNGILVGVLNLTNAKEKKHPPLLLNLVASTAKIIETELKLMNHQSLSAKSYHFFTSMLDHVSESLILVNNQGSINHINKSAAKLLGLPPQNCVGQNIYDITNTDHKDHTMQSVTEMILNGSERTKPVLARFVKVRGDDSDDLGYIATLKEVTPCQGNKAIYNFEDIKYFSSSMEQVISTAKGLATSDIAVFIGGESGTGKELLAQAIHNYGGRSNGPFIPINCAALPRELIQSELFGYEEGAFTGAKKKGNPGKFELAQGGTIFLDEIGDMPLILQSNLLRVLQEKTMTRIGGSKPCPLDVRVISATNKNILEEIEAGRFRADLYYRLSAMTVTIPPLRNRLQDVEGLFRYFLEKHSGGGGINVSANVTRALLAYNWPGNVRELENIALYVVHNLKDNTVTLKEMPEKLLRNKDKDGHVRLKQEAELLTTLDDSEKSVITDALQRCNRNISKAASVLGITRATLYRKLTKYNI